MIADDSQLACRQGTNQLPTIETSKRSVGLGTPCWWRNMITFSIRSVAFCAKKIRKAFLCPECSLYIIAHKLAKVWALLYMCGVALGAMSPSGSTKVLSLPALAQWLEARWPDSEGWRFHSQQSWSDKPLNRKQSWPISCQPTTTNYGMISKDIQTSNQSSSTSQGQSLHICILARQS